MIMALRNRQSGLTLSLAGTGGLAFFWCTDPHSSLGSWLTGGAIDSANQAFWGTLVGMSGSAVALLLGIWLLTRKMV
jgi:hypothetical protein